MAEVANSGDQLATNKSRRFGSRTHWMPPMILRTKVVYDTNEDAVVWAARVTDEDAIYGQ